MKSGISFKVFFITGAALLFFSHPLWANSRHITCSSNGSQYTYCRVHTEDQVRLSRQLSSTDCIEGQSWGYDRHGIWVDRGCRAEFTVGRSGYREYNDRGYDDYDDHRERSHGNHGDYNERDHGNIPGWIIGHFSGKNERDHTAASISVSRNGEATARWAGQDHSGYFDGRNLHLGNKDFIVKQKSRGFETILRQDHSNRVLFYRNR